MKKFVVVLLALALVFGLATTAMAADTQVSFPDVADQNEAAQSSIYRLATLGVLEGYAEDGTFRPAGNITRAEFAKICDYLADKVGAVPTFASMNSAFTDVKIGSWYNGYVIAAYEYSLVNGYTDGTFGPQRNITMAEAVTMLLRVVGYTNELAGAWPYDYIAAAKDLDVLDDVDFVSNRIATRAEVAIMANAILELTKVQYDPDSITVISNKDSVKNQHKSNKYLGYEAIYTTVSNAKDFVALGYDVLFGSFDAYAVEGFFFDDEELYREGAAWGYDDFDKGELVMNYATYDSTPDMNDCEIVDVASKYYICGGGLTDLGGQFAQITYTYNKDKKVVDEVLFVDLTGSVVKSYELKTDGTSNIKADGTKYSESDDYAYMTRSEVNINSDSYGLVYLDEDGEWIGAKDYHNIAFTDARYGIVTDVNDNWIEFNDTKHAIANIALNDKYSKYLDDGFVFIKDGELIEAKDVKVGDVIYRGMLADGDVTYFLVYSPKESSVDKYRQDHYITITDDREYDAHFGYYGENDFDGDLTWLNDVNSLDNEAFDACFYAIAYAYDGLAYVIGDYEDDALGVIVDAYGRGINDSLYDSVTGAAVYKTIVLFGEDGEEHEYVFADTDKYALADMVDDFDSVDRPRDLLGCLVTLVLDKDGKIIDADLEAPFDPQAPSGQVQVSGNYLRYFDNRIWSAKQYLEDDAVIFRVSAKFNGNFTFDKVELVKASKLLKADFSTWQYTPYDTSDSASTINGLYLVGLRNTYVTVDVATDEYQNKDYDKALETVNNGTLNIDDWVEGNIVDYPILFGYYANGSDDVITGFPIAGENGLYPWLQAGDYLHGTDGLRVGTSSIDKATVRSNSKGDIVFTYDYSSAVGFTDRTFTVTADTKFYNLADDKELTFEDIANSMTVKLDESAWFVYVYEQASNDASTCDLAYVVKVDAPAAYVVGADDEDRDGIYTWNTLATKFADLYEMDLTFSGKGRIVIDDVWEESDNNYAVDMLVLDDEVIVNVPAKTALDLTGWRIECSDEGSLTFVLGEGASVTLDPANSVLNHAGDTVNHNFTLVAPHNWVIGGEDWAIWN